MNKTSDQIIVILSYWAIFSVFFMIVTGMVYRDPPIWSIEISIIPTIFLFISKKRSFLENRTRINEDIIILGILASIMLFGGIIIFIGLANFPLI